MNSMNGNPRKDRGTDRDEIRQIQILMLLCLSMSPSDKLRELLEMALATNGEQTVKRATPPEDMSLNGLFDWLSDLFGQGEVTEEERRLLIWQNDKKNMLPAINEIKAIQEKLGLKINIQKNT